MAKRTESGIHSDVTGLTGPGAGLVIVASGGKPQHVPIPLGREGVDLDRGLLEKLGLLDARASRQHARVVREETCWSVSDVGSKNGTYVDEKRIAGTFRGDARIVRVGDSTCLLVDELTPRRREPPRARGGVVLGGEMLALWGLIETYARRSGALHVRGESGSGKELAARHYHDSVVRGGPFVAVNCAAIPAGVAERLLFGTRKGAYSGAAEDAAGYLEQADGGTLFLDEIGELELEIQSKLLRAIELREVVPLGSSRPRKVDFKLCSATHQDLRQLVGARRFRADLFYRIAAPTVVLPPLRDRMEEIPHLIDQALTAVDRQLVAAAPLIDACLLRPWPGNVRELSSEVRLAGERALAASRLLVEASDLAKLAGSTTGAEGAAPPPGAKRAKLPADDAILQALRDANGRVVTAARALGLNRNQLRRWLARTGKRGSS